MCGPMDAEEVILEVARIARATPDEPVKYADKLRALDIMARYHGIYKRDHRQRGESLELEVVLVPPPLRDITDDE